MIKKFVPISTSRAKKLDKDTATESKATLPNLIWANSRAEADLMEKMTDKELERYLAERDGGKEQ